MKNLIVYYSLEGNNKLIAELIHEQIGFVDPLKANMDDIKLAVNHWIKQVAD